MVAPATAAARPLRLGIVLSHPVQYFSSLFRVLATRPGIEPTVYYAFQPSAEQQGGDFGVPFEWDTSLLGGYAHEFLENRARHPGFGFFGCDTPAIDDIIGAGKTDAVLVHGWHRKSYCQAILSCWRHRVPVIVRGDSHRREPRSFGRRMAKELVHRFWVPRFDAYLTVGEWNEEYYSHYGADPLRFFRAGHFVDNDWWNARARELAPRRAELRAQFGIAPGALVVVFAGKFTAVKRPLELLDALSLLRGAPVHLLMAGDGPMRQEAERRAKQRGLPVTFTGFINQTGMPSIYAAGDVLALASRSESWGLVVNEAMASGRPAIVGSRVGCGPELVVTGTTGYAMPSDDVDSLARAMRHYVEQPAEATRQGAAAQAHVAAFSVGHAADQVVRATEAACRR